MSLLGKTFYQPLEDGKYMVQIQNLKEVEPTVGSDGKIKTHGYVVFECKTVDGTPFKFNLFEKGLDIIGRQMAVLCKSNLQTIPDMVMQLNTERGYYPMYRTTTEVEGKTYVNWSFRAPAQKPDPVFVPADADATPVFE